ncbi:MAG: vitamin B12-dependent ribonucleotide reductase [Deltaproteobacteria bacterium]|nr:vitamin B12-dependent ribonucleotide reductase [Deltaproteobacteria bacterium]
MEEPTESVTVAPDHFAGRRLPASHKADRGLGLTMARRFTRPGVHPFDEVAWDRRTASISNTRGEVIFEQKGVEFPSFWSQTATAVVVSKYFRGTLGTADRESSVRQLIGRVVGTIGAWARDAAYFASEDDCQTFEAELTWLLLHQRMSFNSPVWFNVGVEAQPQCSACFINKVDDTMESILTLAKTEGMLFKYGSGTGSNLSPIRSSKEVLAGGGEASGPVSFMKGFDAFAGVIKSGGKTRRAAKMVILNVDHPDIMEFIRCKEKEEKKAWALIEAGYDGRMDGEAYASVFFQNSNNSVRVSDEFMTAVENDGAWETKAITNGRTVDTYRARQLMDAIAESTWWCGDPGMQFDSTINAWHTCPNTARINASNPCSEYMFLDDSACNLASLNLMKFVGERGEFDVEAFRHAVDLTITAQEILVDFAAYPTPAIERNSHDYRPLGLGYANLGAILMKRGLAYDSEEGRAFAAAITALMHGEANLQSARMAEQLGAFPGYAPNREPMLNVMAKHRAAVAGIDALFVPGELMEAVSTVWDDTLKLGEKAGFRNAQVTVLAPTGTIAFMMDCDTTGIEPDIALVKYKKLVGGGTLKIVNQAVPEALERLGYSPKEVEAITAHVDQNDTIEGAPGLLDKDLPVFDCAFRPANGSRSIHYLGHLKMMGAVQPFLSGAISKTVNLPTEATAEEIAETYMAAWHMGVKAVAIYRDGCKRIQPLSTKRQNEDGSDSRPVAQNAPAPQNAAEMGPAQVVEKIIEREVFRPYRKKLSDERQALTHKFSIAGHEGYITVGMYEDGSPGEVFITMAKEGSTLSGLLDAFATAISLALQYGVPLQVLADKFTATRFEPSGFTGNRDIPMAKSITDYIFRWMALKFLDRGDAELEGGETAHASSGTSGSTGAVVKVKVVDPAKALGNGGGTETQAETQRATDRLYQARLDAPLCSSCGRMMTPAGKCYRCDCGQTSGGCS